MPTVARTPCGEFIFDVPIAWHALARGTFCVSSCAFAELVARAVSIRHYYVDERRRRSIRVIHNALPYDEDRTRYLLGLRHGMARSTTAAIHEAHRTLRPRQALQYATARIRSAALVCGIAWPTAPPPRSTGHNVIARESERIMSRPQGWASGLTTRRLALGLPCGRGRLPANVALFVSVPRAESRRYC